MPHFPDPDCLGTARESGDCPSLAGSIDAVMLIIRLSARHGPLMFHHGRAPDTPQPLCRPVGSIRVADDDIKLGDVAGCEYWMEKDVLERIGGGTLLLDVQDTGESAGTAPDLTRRFVLRKIEGRSDTDPYLFP